MPCCIRAANLASSSVAYTSTQNYSFQDLSERKRLLRNTLLWSTLLSISPPREEKGLARPQWQIAVRASVCACVWSSVYFLQISVPSWCRKTTHYRKVDALYLLIHLEDTFINFWKKVSFDLPSPSPFVLPQCALLAGLHRPLRYVFVSLCSH